MKNTHESIKTVNNGSIKSFYRSTNMYSTMILRQLAYSNLIQKLFKEKYRNVRKKHLAEVLLRADSFNFDPI